MQKRVLLVSAAVAVLGLAAAALGFVSESVKSKAFVRYHEGRCVYRRTAAFGCGIAAALLVLAVPAVVAAGSGWFGRRGGAAAPGRRRSTAVFIAWVLVLVAAILFLYGAWRNSGGTRDLTSSREGPRFNRTYRYGCAMLRGGVFATASVASVAAAAFAIAGYVSLHTAPPAAHFAEPGVATGQPQWSHSQPYPPSQFAQPGVAMGQPQWQPQPYPPGYPPVAYPAPPHHDYAAKQPAGTS